MQATLSLPLSPVEAPLMQPSGQPPEAAGRFAAYDDDQEWASFSQAQPAAGQTLAEAGLWESHLVVGGMRCAGCALALERTLLGVKGVRSVRISAGSHRASIGWSAKETRPSAWMNAALAAGYELLPAAEAFAPAVHMQDARLALWRWLVAGFCMMQVMMYAAPSYFSAPGDISPDLERLLRWASLVLSLPVVFFSCRPFFDNALRDFWQRRVSMDLPVALGIAITFAISTAATVAPQGWWGKEVFFDSLTMFVFFLLTGRWLEQLLRQRTAGSLDLLMQRLPASIERQTISGAFERVAVRRLSVGDVIRVLPGEAFPADGTILSGLALSDEALLTGESRPVTRQVGEGVIAGSYNLSQPVELRVDQLGGDTRYAQIVALMEQASLERPRLVRLADRAAKPFIAFVLLAATAAAAFWWNTDPARAVMAAVAVLVVTCPCALSLATPSAMLTSAGAFARRGVLVRRLQAIESLAAIDTVIFDKTGTLTDARMRLRSVHARKGWTESQVLELAGLLAQSSIHPVSRAVFLAWQERRGGNDSDHEALRATPPAISDVHELAGQGLHGLLGPRSGGSPPPGQPRVLRLGSASFCKVEGWPGEGVQLYLADSLGLLARFELGETPRADAASAISAFKSAGIDVHLLSGDRQATVSLLAARLSLDSAKGDCLPGAKLAFVRSLQQQGRKVLMVGDGLNDGPVLAGAHVSVAVGSALPLAQGQSDFVLPGGELLVLHEMLIQSRRCMQVVRQNLAWAAGYNALCVPLALAGYMPAWVAGLGMALSSLVVIGNAARLGFLPKNHRPSDIDAGPSRPPIPSTGGLLTAPGDQPSLLHSTAGAL